MGWCGAHVGDVPELSALEEALPDSEEHPISSPRGERPPSPSVDPGLAAGIARANCVETFGLFRPSGEDLEDAVPVGRPPRYA